MPLMLFLEVADTPNGAAALSQPIVVGAALAANLYNLGWQMRHPEKKLVDLRLVLAVIPACLTGASVGVLLNRALPPIIIIILLAIVIIVNLHATLKKGIAIRQKETEQLKKALASKNQAEGGDQPAPTVLGSDETRVTPVEAAGDVEAPPTKEPSSGEAPVGGEDVDVDTTDTPHAAPFNLYTSESSSQLRRRGTDMKGDTGASGEVQEAAEAPVQQQRPEYLQRVLLIVVWSVVILGVVLRGGKGADSIVGIEMCSLPYWLVTGIAGGTLLVIGFFVRHQDVSLAASFGVGMLSAVVGIGGGLILNPMMLSVGLDATKATATVAVMIIMTSSSAAVSFMLEGAVDVVPTLVLSAVAFLGSMSGKSIIGWLVAKTGRTSILVFLLAAFMALSATAAVVQGTVNGVKKFVDGENPFTEFANPCE